MDQYLIDAIITLEEEEIAMVQEVINRGGDCPVGGCSGCVFGEDNALGNDDSEDCALREDWMVEELDINNGEASESCYEDKIICIKIMEIYNSEHDEFITF